MLILSVLELLATSADTSNSAVNLAIRQLVLPCAVLILAAQTSPSLSLHQFFDDCQAPSSVTS